MNILLTNDDGIFAEGIRILAETLSKKHNVAVAAPANECSCTSHSLTVFKKLSYEKYGYIKGAKGFAIKGTPADCVKFATKVLLDFTPDLILSGINNMPNLGTDVIYSGTVNAALEGAICGFRSIALSVLHEDDGDYRFVSEFMLKNVEKFHRMMTTDTILNINFPSGKPERLRGVRFTKLGTQTYSDEYIEHINDADERHYTLIGDMIKTPENAADCDVELHDGMFVTITPLHIQMTNFDALKTCADKAVEIEL
ncbi:MAG: 5'/3'-nucleotidase SurE [Clostridiales bacterium]|jgi:5'-nucleotidase|nr:5'/3'-nucleotidase SurE [Clostridiales bacterium]